MNDGSDPSPLLRHPQPADPAPTPLSARSFDRRAIPPAARESRWPARDGWSLRRIDWGDDRARDGEGPRGSILFMPGRGDIYEKYLETLDHWHDSGWRVTALDWRGQGGSGRLGTDPLTGHIGDFADWTRDLTDFWDEWVAQTPGPHVLMGHSMGGHLVLRALVDRSVMPDAAVLSAPMLGFIAYGIPNVALLPVARMIVALGDPRRPAWKWSEKPGAQPDERMLLLTGDAERYADEQWWRAHRPELVSGAASWGWIAAAIASARRIEARGAVEAIDCPVLVVTTDADALVAPRPIRVAAARLRHGELVAFGAEARHELLREVDPVRDRVMAAIDGFLDRVVPTPS